MEEQYNMVKDHGVDKLTMAEKMNFAYEGGIVKYCIAKQIVDPDSIIGQLCSWYTWMFNRAYYLPNLMALEPDEMTPESNDLFILGWVLTGEEKYVDNLLKCLGSNNTHTSRAGTWDIIRLCYRYPSFKSIVGRRSIFVD